MGEAVIRCFVLKCFFADEHFSVEKENCTTMFENEKLFAFFLCALAKRNKKEEFRRRKEL